MVEVVGRHGGWVNKFEGDAALCVFGAPGDHPDAGGRRAGGGPRAAPAAARRAGVDAASASPRARPSPATSAPSERYEYTVIGDPVNEAARLCELAKRRDERLLASRVLDRTRSGEAERWAQCDEVVLRGRRTATRVATPASVGATASAARA